MIFRNPPDDSCVVGSYGCSEAVRAIKCRLHFPLAAFDHIYLTACPNELGAIRILEQGPDQYCCIDIGRLIFPAFFPLCAFPLFFRSFLFRQTFLFLLLFSLLLKADYFLLVSLRIILVEFKRPGDETPSKDPVNQVLDYIKKLKSKTVRDVQGEVVSEIREETPFECYIICDFTEATRKLLSRSLAPHETPDEEGYFGFAPNHKAAIHVISFKKMLRDAELRNEVFFRKLGLVKP